MPARRPVLESLRALGRETLRPGTVKELLSAARRRSVSPRPPRRADDLAEIVLRDHAGERVRLGGLWSESPAALVFLRHYG